MVPAVVGDICSSCRRGDIHGKRDAERRASKPAQGGTPTRPSLDHIRLPQPAVSKRRANSSRSTTNKKKG